MNKFKVGDLVEVVIKSGERFKGIVVEDYRKNLLVCRVLNKSSKVGTASWDRYSLEENCRVQPIEDCESITVVAESTVVSANNSLTLEEGVSRKNEVTYYKTNIGDGIITLCLCEGKGGWSFDSDEPSALKESYINALSQS